MSPVPDLYAIREATEADLPDILEIYNERVLNSTCLFIYEPVTLENRLAWFKETKENNYPIIVAVDNATQKTIAYASLGAFRGKPAYNLYDAYIVQSLDILVCAGKELNASIVDLRKFLCTFIQSITARVSAAYLSRKSCALHGK